MIILLNFCAGFCQIQWQKYEHNPVLSWGAPGSWNEATIISPTVSFDGTIYHMWFTGSKLNPIVYTDYYMTSFGYASSENGKSWSEYQTAPVFAASGGDAWDSHVVEVPCVIYDNSMYHMWYSGYNLDNFLQFTPQIGYATSLDGIHWERYAGNQNTRNYH